MFQLLHPIWLLATAATAIPLLIHLWNIRQGKTLQIGSIFLLRESAKQPRSLRLTDILLLLLRCLLIIILSLLMANPTWQKKNAALNEPGWIVIEKQSLPEAYKNYKSTIDSLVKKGYTFHCFNTGFEMDNLKDALKTSVEGSNNDASYWALLTQLSQQLDPNIPVYLFTDNKLKRFSGTRPQLALNLNWRTYTASDTVATSVIKAYKTAGDSIRIIIAKSTPEATFYATENIAGNGSRRYRVVNDNGKIAITTLDPKTSATLAVDTSTLTVDIYTDPFSIDAGYIKAAVDAIQQYTGLKIKSSVIGNASSINPAGDWLFWLSEKGLPAQNLPPNVFVYETGKEQAVNSWITTNNYSINQEPVQLFRMVINSSGADNSYENLWKDGFGHALLSLEKKKSDVYHFYSRFNPGWNDLPWSPQFPEMIFTLLIRRDTGVNNVDNRIIDDSQLQPVVVKKSNAHNNQKFIQTIPLTKLFWLMAFIVFSVERTLSLTGNKSNTYA